jgi:hypothetical protein
MKWLPAAMAAMAVALGIQATGCGEAEARPESCREAEANNAFGADCGTIRWHEAHEGPTIYNNFHGTQP